MIDGLCPECYLEEHPMIEVPQDLEVKTCAQCLSRHTGLRWEDPPEDVEDVEELLFKYAVDEFMENVRTLPDVRIEVEPLEIKGKPGGPGARVLVELLVTGSWEVQGGKILTRRYHVTVPIVFSLCDRCMKFRSGYYEAILQVRSLRGTLTEHERSDIEEFVQRAAASMLKRDPMAYVSDVEHLEEGIDFYIGSLNAARKLARRLVETYGGTMGESHKLVGFDRDRGKERYKAAISVRIPHFNKGDVVLVNERPYLVLSTGSRCILRHLISGEVKRCKWDELEDAKVLEPEPAIIIDDSPLRVTLERTGDVFECHESDVDVRIGQRVQVVLIDDVAILVPEER